MTRTRILVSVLVGVALLGACGGDDDSDDTVASSTAPETSLGFDTTTAAETTVPPTATESQTTATTVPGEQADFPCGGTTNLADALMAYANAGSPQAGVEYLVTGVVLSEGDPTWGRGQVSAPPDLGIEGFIGIGHCTDAGWEIVDAGTSGVGCAAEVPDDLGIEC